MSIFKKKSKYAFSDILKGLHSAVNSAQEMLQVQQVQSLTKFWVGSGGEPVSQKLKVGNKEVDVPLMSLVSHPHLEMDDIEIKFKARIGDVVSHSVSDQLKSGNALNYSELQMEMDGISAKDDDVMEITIRFKSKDAPEGVARLTDEYNKFI